jgi:hypothetical protein
VTFLLSFQIHHNAKLRLTIPTKHPNTHKFLALNLSPAADLADADAEAPAGELVEGPELVPVVDELLICCTTVVTLRPVELWHLPLERRLAWLLKVMSAHCFAI